MASDSISSSCWVDIRERMYKHSIPKVGNHPKHPDHIYNIWNRPHSGIAQRYIVIFLFLLDNRLLTTTDFCRCTVMDGKDADDDT